MNNNNKKISLFKWIWYSFLKTALIPLVLVELVFVGIYFFTNNWSQKETIKYLRAEVIDEMNQISIEKSQNIDQQLKSIAYSTKLLGRQYLNALMNDADLDDEDASRLSYSNDGAYYTLYDKSEKGVAIFYSGIYTIGEDERYKVTKLLTTEDIMKDVVETQPLVAQAYFNTFDSLNIIYPYFEVLTQYPVKMDIPSYNFYYQADYEHNPEKDLIWTEAYLDPAGMGWMTSAILPIYNGDFLEGVVGIDITISTITNQVLDMEIPWGGYSLLVDSNGSILALPEIGETEWGLDELTKHNYIEAIQEDTFKPEQFNIYTREELKNISEMLKTKASGNGEVTFNNDNKVISWSTINEAGWKLLIIVPEKNIYADVNNMKELLFKIGMFMILGLISFYIVFFYILSRKSRKMSYNISEPLISINNMVKSIGKGEYYQEPYNTKVLEIYETSENLSLMGYRLGRANEKLLNTQKELQQNEYDLKSLVYAIEDVIIVSDIDGNIEKIWNKSKEINISSNDIEGFIGKTKKEIKVIIDKVLKKNQTETLEFVVDTPKGSRWLQARISLVQGKDVKVVMAARDVTDMKELEKSLILAKEEAEKASNSKSEFLSSMSHELRTPLNAVIGFSQILQMDKENPLSKEQNESVVEILKAGKHLLVLINEILDLSKIESGNLSISIENVKVETIVRETVSMIYPMAESYGIKLITGESECCKEYVKTDLTRIKQVMINLISNAIKYNKDDGEVKFYCEKIEEKIRFNIVDTGIGITKNNLKNIFQPFQRLDFNNSEIEGTGIGLTVAEQLVKAMDGEIYVESVVGEGSHFYVEIPISNDILVHDEEFSSLNINNSEIKNKFKILYVEDNPANLKLIQKLVSSIPGTEFFSAVMGETSIELAKAHKPDLIILDINLPGISGYEVFERFKLYEETKDVPVVALSANAMNKDIEKAKKMGFKEYFTKPVDGEKFIKKIHEIIRLKGK